MNIGMFPMSGIRVCDPELLELGFTLPGFVERRKTIASLPSLGLLTLAGMTPEKHKIHYVEIPDETLVHAPPTGLDLAAISSSSAQIDRAYAMAQSFKSMGVPTVMGGAHVTSVPEEAARYCDTVVIGEGEPVWHKVLEDAANGRLRQFYHADPDDYDMKDAPMPAFELLDFEKYNRIIIQTSRGCPHQCEFCASSLVLTPKYKQKPLAKVLAEIERVEKIWGRPLLEFADDNCLINRAYWKELLTAIKEKGIKWFAVSDISLADDLELLRLMREAGCVQVLIGLESPTDTALKGLELKNNWKFKKFPQYKEAIRTIQEHGITVNGCFVIGFDAHDKQIFDDIRSFVKDSGLYEVQITILTPFPGTPLYKRLEREGRLLEPHNWKKCTLFDLNFTPAKMTEDELRAGFKQLMKELYSGEFTKWRRSRFMQARRQQKQKGDQK